MWILSFKKIFFRENNKVLSILGFGEKLFGFISIIFLMFNLQLANIDNLP